MLKNIRWDKLKNKGLNRTLTEWELEAVDWWVTTILDKKPQYKYNAKKSIISIGNIPNILEDFNKHAGDFKWENHERMVMKQILENAKKIAEIKLRSRPPLPCQRGQW